MTFKNLDYPPNREALADQFILVLNELVRADHEAMEALVEFRVPCGEVLGEHPTVQTVLEGNDYKVGLLGILNGLVGTRPEDGWGYIAASFDNDEKFIGFIRTPPPKNAG